MSRIAVRRAITKRVRERLEGKEGFKIVDGQAYYHCYPLISSGSGIGSCLYVDSTAREAIYVNTDGDSLLRPLLSQAEQNARQPSTGRTAEERILRAVYKVTDDAFPTIDDDAVRALVERLGAGDDGIVSLDVFLRHGVGSCVHTTLTAAALLERFHRLGNLQGKVSADRVTLLDKPEGHAYCSYTPSTGPKDPWVLDIANQYCGLASHAPADLVWMYHPVTEDRLKTRTVTRSKMR